MDRVCVYMRVCFRVSRDKCMEVRHWIRAVIGGICMRVCEYGWIDECRDKNLGKARGSVGRR